MSSSLPDDSCVDHVPTACKEQMDAEGSSDFRHSFTTVRTEAIEREANKFNKCLGVRTETSQRATVVAWGPFQTTFWLRSQGSPGDPAFQDGGLRSPSRYACREARSRRAHREVLTSSPGPLVAPPAWAQLLASHTTAPVWLASTCGVHRSLEARFLASPCCCFSWGRLLRVTAQPQDDQLPFLCHTGRQKGTIAL